MSNLAAARLRELIAKPGLVLAPGAADGLTAKLTEQAGFSAAYCTGVDVSRSRGYPDVGITTLTELAERVGNMVDVCRLPLIVDIDSGFGNVITLMRAVRTFDRIGAAALHVEDMEIPRRMAGGSRNLVESAEMVGRVRAALQARVDPNFIIITRTDALAYLGLGEAIDRANRYADAGADMIYMEFLKDRRQMEIMAQRVAAPKLIAISKGENELLAAEILAEMGYKMLMLPADVQLAVIHAIRELFLYVQQVGTTAGFDAMVTFADRDRIVGLANARAIEEEYLPGGHEP